LTSGACPLLQGTSKTLNARTPADQTRVNALINQATEQFVFRRCYGQDEPTGRGEKDGLEL